LAGTADNQHVDRNRTAARPSWPACMIELVVCTPWRGRPCRAENLDCGRR
jgi:hypothetical protein